MTKEQKHLTPLDKFLGETLPTIIAILALAGAAWMLFMEDTPRPEEMNRPLKKLRNPLNSEITLDCRDGVCYDPKSGKPIGKDMAAPVIP